MALTSARATASRQALLISAGVLAATVLFQGGMVAINASGFMVPASADATLRVVGVAPSTFDNSTGGDGDIIGEADRRCHRLDNSSSADAITDAHIGKPCYAVDDHTVALTSNGGTRPVAGVIMGTDEVGVWVDFSQNVSGAPITLNLGAVSNKAADAAVVRIVSPIAGKITKIRSVLNAALATGDATLTGKIGANAITGGAVTVTQVGSAAGDVDVATPTAANVVAAGDVISFTGGGASTATSTSTIQVEITPN